MLIRVAEALDVVSVLRWRDTVDLVPGELDNVAAGGEVGSRWGFEVEGGVGVGRRFFVIEDGVGFERWGVGSNVQGFDPLRHGGMEEGWGEEEEEGMVVRRERRENCVGDVSFFCMGGSSGVWERERLMDITHAHVKITGFSRVVA